MNLYHKVYFLPTINFEFFQAEIYSLIESTNQNNEVVVNADETAIFVLPSNPLTQAEIGAQDVNLNVIDNEKQRISVMCTITAEIHELPLFLSARGTTTM